MMKDKKYVHIFVACICLTMIGMVFSLIFPAWGYINWDPVLWVFVSVLIILLMYALNAAGLVFRKKITDITIESDTYSDIRIWWQDHYRAQHGMELDLSQVLIPVKPDGDDWILLCIAQGLTPNREFDSWTFPKWRVQRNLDHIAHTDQRNTTKTYFVWVKNGFEPDLEFLGESTNQADPNMQIGVTLLERLVLQSYAYRMGLVLDEKGTTLCSGSRGIVGGVPRVCLYHGGEVNVDWCSADGRDGAYGIRRAVTA